MQYDWKDILQNEVEKEYFRLLASKIKDIKKRERVFPDVSHMLRALELTNFDKIKVVILGQDPYHGEGQANGLAFSVPSGQQTPPSLRNIFKQLHSEYGINRTNTDLTDWATQGVLLLNDILTVSENRPASHANLGWEKFTDHIVKEISDKLSFCVFLLWGKYAQSKTNLIDEKKHKILCTTHPSPLSAHSGFLGCNHFSEANKLLQEKHLTEIKWV